MYKKNLLVLDNMLQMIFVLSLFMLLAGTEMFIYIFLGLMAIGMYNFLSSHIHYFGQNGSDLIKKLRKQHLIASYIFFVVTAIVAILSQKITIWEDFIFPFVVCSGFGFFFWYFYISFKDWKENKINLE
ncbi:MAG: hypothetical protein EAZ97_12695 [Bacteroidetes bacterium]|nr:MAG: hypothetical protein EAZ97_12695 [Bacteroidota bacterium]